MLAARDPKPRALAAASTTLGMWALSSLCVVADEVGPAARVTFRDYLPVEGIALGTTGALLGALLGADIALRALRAEAAAFAVVRLAAGSIAGALLGLIACVALAIAYEPSSSSAGPLFMIPFAVLLLTSWAGSMLLSPPLPRAPSPSGPRAMQRPLLFRAELAALALLALWALFPQLRAFPAHASLSQRERWARERVPQFPALAELVKQLPEVRGDLGHVQACAPTAEGRHVSAREMNGDDLRFTLDVVGERGRGVLYVDCTIDGSRVFDWRSARWTYKGRSSTVPAPAIDRTQSRP